MPHGVSHSKTQPTDQQQRKSKTEQRARAECQLAILSRPFRLRFIFVEVSVHKRSSQLTVFSFFRASPTAAGSRNQKLIAES
jgi:hypothetical protein